MMNRSLSASSATLAKARLITWGVLFVVASVSAGVLFLVLMSMVGMVALLLKALGDVRVSYAVLDQVTIISLAACAALGLAAFACMAWGASARDDAKSTGAALKARAAGRMTPNRQGHIKVWVNKSA